jgi:hypothetical protein
MSAENREGGYSSLERDYGAYTVYDQHYEKVGRVDDVFVDHNDRPEYIGVKTGFLGMQSTLIPVDIIRVNDRRKLIEVAADEGTIKHAPTFDNDSDLTPDFEDRVHAYFGMERPELMRSSGQYGGYYDSRSEDPAREEDLRYSVDTEFGERSGATDRPTESAPTVPAGGDNLDVPPAESGSTAEPPPREGTEDPFDADAATRTEGDTREDLEVQGGTTGDESDVRVFKRARTDRR